MNTSSSQGKGTWYGMADSVDRRTDPREPTIATRVWMNDPWEGRRPEGRAAHVPDYQDGRSARRWRTCFSGHSAPFRFPAASVSMDIPRVRMQWCPSPWRCGRFACRRTTHLSVSLGIPSPSIAAVSRSSISSIHDRRGRPFELVGIQSETVDGRNEGRFQGWSKWMHVSVIASFSPCACLSSSFSSGIEWCPSMMKKRYGMPHSPVWQEERLHVREGLRQREGERQREREGGREREGCLFDGSIGPPTRSVEPKW